jgi:hypothetical protein
MKGRGLRAVEDWSPLAFEAWPDEALKRGLPRPLAKKGKNRGGEVFGGNVFVLSAIDHGFILC